MLPLVLVTACASGSGGDYMGYLARKGVTQVSLEKFEHCHGYGCRLINEARLSAADWQEIAAHFTAVTTPQEERAAIAPVIGLFERKIGAVTGTDKDIAGTYVKLGDDQHDCVDESVNTTIYLSLLQDKGLLRHHDIGIPSARVPPFSRGIGPHQTAVIVDRQTSKRYAVDSWFHDNGHAAEIVAMDKWFFGWRPEKTPKTDGEEKD